MRRDQCGESIASIFEFPIVWIMYENLWELLEVAQRLQCSWGFLRVYPKAWRLRSWRQEVEDSFNAATWIRRFLLESLRVCIVPWSDWELPRVCAVVSRPASLQILHFILRSLCDALYSNNNAASFLNLLCSDFWPPTLMHISFEALLGIFNALILRLDEFFPFDHLENSDIFFLHAFPAPNNLPWLSSEIRHSNDPKKLP